MREELAIYHFPLYQKSFHRHVIKNSVEEEDIIKIWRENFSPTTTSISSYNYSQGCYGCFGMYFDNGIKSTILLNDTYMGFPFYPKEYESFVEELNNTFKNIKVSVVDVTPITCYYSPSLWRTETVLQLTPRGDDNSKTFDSARVLFKVSRTPSTTLHTAGVRYWNYIFHIFMRFLSFSENFVNLEDVFPPKEGWLNFIVERVNFIASGAANLSCYRSISEHYINREMLLSMDNLETCYERLDDLSPKRQTQILRTLSNEAERTAIDDDDD